MISLKQGLGVAIMFLACVGMAEADRPLFVTIPVDRTFVSPSFSEACGFEVDITQVGFLKGTVFYDASGARIVKEIDTQPGFLVRVSSPASGKSFSFPFATMFHFEYANGVTPGASVVVTAHGLVDKVPGIPADAGVATYGNAKVLFVDPTGVPIVDFGAPTAFEGKANDPAAAVAALCSALAP